MNSRVRNAIRRHERGRSYSAKILRQEFPVGAEVRVRFGGGVTWAGEVVETRAGDSPGFVRVKRPGARSSTAVPVSYCELVD